MATTSSVKQTSATREVRTTDLVGVSSVVFMRPVKIAFAVSGVKPFTRLHAFFDGRLVDQWIVGNVIISDASGNAGGEFHVPPMTFNTGDREFKLQDTAVYSPGTVAGSTVSYATAMFRTSAVKNTLRQTIETITTNTINTQINVIDPPPPPVRAEDPLAQSFFTYGVNGGCFVTGIEVFFQSKSSTVPGQPSIPVTLDIRELVNGTPSSKLVNGYASATIAPANITLIDEAKLKSGAAGTKFVFPVPVYLAENKDWCFVLTSNSNEYHVWTSKLGEKSIETGKTIFEQPFIGSLFKSENNITWTADQTEDIKFKIYKAQFSTAPQIVDFKAEATPVWIYGSQFSVTAGSNIVTVNCNHQHGLAVSDLMTLLTGTATHNVGAVFRGIPVANLNGNHAVKSVIDPYSFTFQTTVNATSTGSLALPGIVQAVVLDSGGSGYTGAVQATFAPPPSGVTATASVVVVGGKITAINVVNRGSGYLDIPVLTLSETPANPAKFAVISESVFGFHSNNVVNAYKPIIANGLLPNTSLRADLTGTFSDYSAVAGETVKIGEFKTTSKPHILVNGANKAAKIPGRTPTNLRLTMATTNPNTTPIVSLGELPRIQTLTCRINNPVEIKNPLDPLSELHPTGGNALSKYVTKQFTVTKGVGVRMYVNAACLFECSFDVYFRSSKAGFGAAHKDQSWTKMYCDTARNLSKREDEFIDYQFYLLNLEQFDLYDIKIVMKSSNSSVFPRIANYRAIILAE